jgi:hypothetical protein
LENNGKSPASLSDAGGAGDMIPFYAGFYYGLAIGLIFFALLWWYNEAA